MTTNLIEPRIGKLILNHLIGNNCPEFLNDGLLDSHFFKLTLESGCLELCFKTVAFKNVLTQSFSSQGFKHKLAHMCSLNLTPKLSFELRFCIFIINVYYTKSKRL